MEIVRHKIVAAEHKLNGNYWGHLIVVDAVNVKSDKPNFEPFAVAVLYIGKSYDWLSLKDKNGVLVIEWGTDLVLGDPVGSRGRTLSVVGQLGGRTESLNSIWESGRTTAQDGAFGRDVVAFSSLVLLLAGFNQHKKPEARIVHAKSTEAHSQVDPLVDVLKKTMQIDST